MSASSSTSLEPARRERPWLPAVVVAAVAMLAVIAGLVVASFLLGNRNDVVGAGASYVPADAPLYVELRLEPSAAQDASLRELIGRFPDIDGVDLDRPLAEQLVEVVDEALAEDGTGLSWSDDVAPWTDGRLSVAVLDITDALTGQMADPMAAPEPPAVLVTLGVTDADAARDAVERMFDAVEAPEWTTTEHRGVTVHSGEQGAYAVTPDQLLVAMDREDVEAALDTSAGGSSLATREDHLAYVEALPSDWLAFGVMDMTDAMRVAMEGASTEAGEAGARAMARLLEHQSMVSAFTISADGDGLSFDAAGPAATGPFAPESAERGFAAEVPGTALYFGEGGNLGPAMVEIIAVMKDSVEADPASAEQLAMAEAALGANLEELVSWVGDGALTIGWDGVEVYGGLLLEVTDEDAARRRLDQLATFAGLAAMDPSTGITVDEGEIAGTPVTTITWSDPNAVPMPPISFTGLTIQYALTGDRAVIGIGEGIVGDILELDEADSLAAEPRYADAIADLGGPSVAGSAWVDLASIADVARDAMDAMGGTAETTDDIFSWLAPLDRLVSVSVLDGDVVVQRSKLILR